jgi:hypothetical protein
MGKELGRNDDWIARDGGRIPSKGARAAQRASAGLGATDHDAEQLSELLSLEAVRERHAKSRVRGDSRRPPGRRAV